MRDTLQDLMAVGIKKPKSASDHLVPCLDPKAGSKMACVPDGDHVTLNDTKEFISNGTMKDAGMEKLVGNEIISPFSGRLSAKFLALTPREIKVANLIKEGKSSKEIAELLNVFVRAIDFHRGNLRKRVGLKNQKANLRSYLLSLA